MTMARHYTRPSGADAGLLRAAFRLNCELMQARRSEIMDLAVHTKARFDGIVRGVGSDEGVKGFDPNNCAQIKGITIQWLTEKIPVRTLNGPVLAVFVNPAKLDKVIAWQGVTDLVFAPWVAAEPQAYESIFPESISIPVFSAPRHDAPAAGVQEV